MIPPTAWEDARPQWAQENQGITGLGLLRRFRGPVWLNRAMGDTPPTRWTSRRCGRAGSAGRVNGWR